MSADELTATAAATAADELWQRLQDSVAAIGPDQWHLPTPCARWDVHDLVAHVAGVGGMFYGIPQPPSPEGWSAPDDMSALDAAMQAGVVARADRTPSLLAEEIAAARAGHVAALAALPDLTGEAVGPTGPTDQRALLRVRMFDMWHHLWDLRTALGLPVDTDDRSVGARECHAYVAAMAPWLYGKRAGAPEGGAVRLRLGPPLASDRSIAVRDGRASWVEQPAADVVEGPPAAFSLLMTGRIDRDGAAALGLRASGAEADRLLRARVF